MSFTQQEAVDALDLVDFLYEYKDSSEVERCNLTKKFFPDLWSSHNVLCRKFCEPNEQLSSALCHIRRNHKNSPPLKRELDIKNKFKDLWDEMPHLCKFICKDNMDYTMFFKICEQAFFVNNNPEAQSSVEYSLGNELKDKYLSHLDNSKSSESTKNKHEQKLKNNVIYKYDENEDTEDDDSDDDNDSVTISNNKQDIPL